MLVDVLVPVLGRPHRAAPFMQSLERTARGRCRVTAIAGADDLVTIDAWARAGANIVICPAEPGTFAQRVNYGFTRTHRPHVFICGDDVLFHDEWLDELQRVIERFPPPRVVGTNDLGNGAVMAGEHATHLLLDRSYVELEGASWDGPGVVCHEGYRHCYVDDEIVTAAKQRGVWQPCLTSIVEHLHPSWHKAPIDATYAIGIQSMGNDGLLYQERLASHS